MKQELWRPGRRKALSTLLVGAVAAVGAVATGQGCARHTVDTKPEVSAKSSAGPTAAAAPAEDRFGLRRVAQQAMPAVVSVASTRPAAEPRTPNLPFDDPFFRRFFGPDSPFRSGPHSGPLPPQRGLGSGVIVSGNVILTNAHVVDGATKLVVTTHDRRSLEVELAGVDAKSDLAVLRIKGDTTGLKPLAFADSDTVELGQVVLAIGNPFGVGETVTMGIVSAKGRADLGIVDYEDFIQTDAAINPGNSGGALVDLNGNLVGIPTAILSRTGGYMGVGFAIPSNMAKPIMQSLLETGRVARSYLGVSIQDVDQDLAKALGLESVRGVLVADVVADSPSAKAGLQRGDVILAVEGKAMSSAGQLRNTIATAGIGKQVELQVWRDGQTRKVTVSLGAMPEEKPSSSSTPGGSGAGALGATLAPLDADVRRQLDVPPDIKAGVVVTDVEVNSKAFEAGIRRGDVILELGGSSVTSPERLRELWQKSSGAVAILLFREGRTLYVAVKH